MIVLDTYIWLWWVHDTNKLTSSQIEIIQQNENDSISISMISVWEIAKLVEYKRLELPVEINKWLKMAKSYPGINLINLSEEIILESTSLPDDFHKDPADQIIVATARASNCSLVTSDAKIIEYPYVNTVK